MKKLLFLFSLILLSTANVWSAGLQYPHGTHWNFELKNKGSHKIYVVVQTIGTDVTHRAATIPQVRDARRGGYKLAMDGVIEIQPEEAQVLEVKARDITSITFYAGPGGGRVIGVYTIAPNGKTRYLSFTPSKGVFPRGKRFGFGKVTKSGLDMSNNVSKGNISTIQSYRR